MEISPDAIILHRKGIVFYANPAAVRLLGASHPGEILGKNILDYVQPEYLAAVRRNIRDDLKGESTPTIEMGMVRVDGVPITIEGRGVRAFIDGEPAVQVAMRDITERKRAEEELFKSRQMLQQVLDTIPVRVFWKDRNSVFLGCNKALALDAGYEDPAEIIGKTDYETASAATADAYRSDDREVMETGRPKIGFEEPQIRPDGSPAWLRTNKVPLRTRTGDVIGVLGTYEDITEQKEKEEEFRASEERFRYLLERSFNAVVIHKDGKIVVANDAAVAIAGTTSPQDLIGKPITAFIHPKSRQFVQERVETMLRVPGMVMPLARETFLKLGGEPIEVEVMATSYLDCGTAAIQIIFREISEAAKMEEALRRSEEIYRTIAESAADMIYISDNNGILIYANTLCARMFGCAPSDLFGKRQEELFPPEIAREHLTYIRQVVTTGEPVEHEESVPTPAGTFRIDIKLSPIRSHDGTVVSVVGIARDITSRKPGTWGRGE